MSARPVVKTSFMQAPMQEAAIMAAQVSDCKTRKWLGHRKAAFTIMMFEYDTATNSLTFTLCTLLREYI